MGVSAGRGAVCADTWLVRRDIMLREVIRAYCRIVTESVGTSDVHRQGMVGNGHNQVAISDNGQSMKTRNIQDGETDGRSNERV